MPEPKQFRVCWTYLAEAESPRAAAAQALAAQSDASSLSVAFDVQATDGTARERVTVDLHVSAIECRHTIPGVVYPAQTNGDDEHDWVERCDTCAIYDTDEDAAAAVVAYYRGCGTSMVLGHARPFGVDHDCPYVERNCATARPALPQALVIARLEAAGWHEVAADLRAGQPAHVVLARLAEDPDRREAASCSVACAAALRC